MTRADLRRLRVNVCAPTGEACGPEAFDRREWSYDMTDFMVTLETERLTMRMWRESDFEQYAVICADPDVMRFLGEGKPLSRLEAWRHMATLVGHWHLRGFGHWAVEEKESRRLIGRIGFLHPEEWPGFELGWTLGREFWGRGYATEGARRALAYAFTEMGRDHVISLIDPENKASIKVAERLGERAESKTELAGKELIVYGIDRAVWQAA
jgi:RimJ/RimL family protein N-acetyltransferase